MELTAGTCGLKSAGLFLGCKAISSYRKWRKLEKGNMKIPKK
jgi:hypothetical protein